MRRRHFTPERLHGLRVRLCLLLIGLILLMGTVGYRVIEGWSWLDSLYMTVITISTVGFTEVQDLSRRGELFTIVLIFSGVGTVALAFTGLVEAVLQRQIRLMMERHSMQKEINQLNRHVIVCGYGRIGRLVANELASTARDFVVVEEQATVVEEIVRQQMLVVEGSATDEEVLEKAGLSRAAALVAALGSDADNLLLTMTARGLNRGLDIIARAETPASSRKFSRAGANHVVLPHVIGANHIVQLLTRPSVVDFIELVTRDEDIHLEVRQIEIGPDSPFAHRTLAEAHIRQATGCMVLAIRRPGQRTVFDPQPDTRILPGDTLVAVGSCAGGRTPGAAPPTSPAS